MSEEKEKQHWSIALKPYTLKELASIYGISKNTFRKWLEPLQESIKERMGNYYSIHQVKIIFTALQLPSHVRIEGESEYGLYDKLYPHLHSKEKKKNDES